MDFQFNQELGYWKTLNGSEPHILHFNGDKKPYRYFWAKIKSFFESKISFDLDSYLDQSTIFVSGKKTLYSDICKGENKPMSGKLVLESVKNCTELRKKYRVIPGESWGSIPVDKKSLWQKLACDENYDFTTQL